MDNVVFALAPGDNGSMYVGGNFTNAGGAAASRVALWTGSDWTNVGVGLVNAVNALALDGGGNLFAGGAFTAITGGAPANRVARWDGVAWTNLGSGLNSAVNVVLPDGGGLFVGGQFTTADGATAHRVARWNGTVWTNLGEGIFGTAVYELVPDGVGGLYVAGGFTNAGGQAIGNIAHWSGTAWTNLAGGLDGAARALVRGANGLLYAGGDFSSAGGVAASCVAQWDGTNWAALGPGLNGSVQCLTLAPNGRLYAGGMFTNSGGVAANRVACWDGANWIPVGTGMPLPVAALAFDTAGRLYAGGSFTTAGGQPANRIARTIEPIGLADGPELAVLGANGDEIAAGDGSPSPADGTDFGEARVVGGFVEQVFVITNSGPVTCQVTGGSVSGANAGDFSVLALPASLAPGEGSYMVARFTPGGTGVRTATLTVNNDDADEGAYDFAVQGTGTAPTNWGVVWSGLAAGVPSGSVLALASDGEGGLYAGGTFTNVGGVAANNVAMWNGVAWTNLGSGVNSSIRALVWDGSSLFAGGDFTNAGGTAARYIARWDGATWENLGVGVDGSVLSLAWDGASLYAGGAFTGAGGAEANRIARWNGTTWTNLGLGMNNLVTALAWDGSYLYAGGNLTNAGGVAVSGVARWDGGAWTNLGAGFNQVNTLAWDGVHVYAGGPFTNSGSMAANGVARWDGVRWTNLSAGVGSTVISLACDPSGVVYAGGTFTSADGRTANRIAAWDGQAWRGLAGGLSSTVRALAMDGPGRVYVGGDFPVADGVALNRIALARMAPEPPAPEMALLGINGSVITLGDTTPSVVDGTSFGGVPILTGIVERTFAFTNSGNAALEINFSFSISVSDGFEILDTPESVAPGGSSNFVIRFAPDTPGVQSASIHVSNEDADEGDYSFRVSGTGVEALPAPDDVWTNLAAGLGNEVNALAVAATNRVYAGGTFTTAGGQAADYVAEWDGAAWTNLGAGVDDSVYALASAGGGGLYAGGAFTMAGGQAANRIAFWNGGGWTNLGTGVDDLVFALKREASGKLYVGGQFTHAGGVEANRVAQWDGLAWTNLGEGFDGDVYALARDAAGNLYAGGLFDSAGDVAASSVAKWDGTSWTNLGEGCNNSVYALVCDPAGNVYAGGPFTSAGGVPASGMAKWDGTSWSALGEGCNEAVDALAWDGGGRLCAGGRFTLAGGAAAARVAVWDGVTWTNVGAGAHDNVFAVAFDPRGVLYAGGTFTNAGGKAAARIARTRSAVGSDQVAPADVAVSKAFTGGSTMAGGTLTYRITVTNSGPQAAANVVLTEYLPAGTTSPDPVITNLGALAAFAGTSLTVRVVTSLDVADPITNRVSVLSAAFDPNQSNNTASAMVVVTPPLHVLSVATPFGHVVPPPGQYQFFRNAPIACSVSDSPIDLVTTQYVCSGWVGTGSVPASGAGIDVTLALTNAASSLTWRWMTNVWFAASAAANGEVVASNGWRVWGTLADALAVPDEGYRFASWTGDVPSENATQNPVAVPMSSTRAITATFAPVVPVLYVDAAATGIGDGGSWNNALTNLQQALELAVASQELWIAQGVYRPGTARTNYFALRPQVPLFGGFTNGMASRTMRDWRQHRTTLSGDLGVPGVVADNCYHVVMGSGGVRLDGFTIAFGNANGGGSAGAGGGVWLTAASGASTATVANCVLVSNVSVTAGGGLFAVGEAQVEGCEFSANRSGAGGGLYDGSGIVPRGMTLVDCLFVGNAATNGHGGGVCLPGAGGFSQGGLISNCVFVANTAAARGGGAYLQRVGQPLAACRFLDNQAGTDGGGLHLGRQGDADFVQGIFAGNRATRGGGLSVDGDMPTIQHAVFAGNVATTPTGQGGAVAVVNDSAVPTHPALLACTLAENVAGPSGGQALFASGSVAQPTHLVLLDSIAWTTNSAALLQTDEGVITGDYSCVNGGLVGTANTASDPLFCGGASGLWSGSATYDAASGRSLLTPGVTNWTANLEAGTFFSPDTRQPRQFLIEACSTNSLSVWGDVTSLLAPGQSYRFDDYRLATTNSPCFDRGVVAGFAYLGRAPEMGAYEYGFTARIRVLLQGAYDPNTGRMRTALQATGALPLTAPYQANARTVASVPPGATDWVLAQIDASTNGGLVWAQSVFVGADGWLLADDGTTGIVMSVAAGAHLLTLKHRNHLAIRCAQPLAFTNAALRYDFTSGSAQTLGGTNGVLSVATGVWAMAAGDADGDGILRPADAAIARTQLGRAGYMRGDFTLDGIVLSNDVEMADAGLGRRSTAPAPETALTPALTLNLPRLTLLAGGNATFRPRQATGDVHWAFVQNGSGSAAISNVYTGNSLAYVAGSASPRLDVLEAWDQSNRLGRALINVLGSNDVAQAGKAIIIAGRKSTSDPLWPTTDYLAGNAYNTLRYRGYARENIAMLSPLPGRDVDGNGLADDIDGATTWTNAATLFTHWSSSDGPLFVYLVDHGAVDDQAEGFMRLNADERLTASQLDGWLDDLQNAYSNPVVVVLDFCQAGVFINTVTYDGAAPRIVLAACEADEPTYFVAGGRVSFSTGFFTGVLLGLSVAESFTLGQQAVATYQSPVLGDPSAGAAQHYVGSRQVAGVAIPVIGRVIGRQVLRGNPEALLWASDIVAAQPLARVWCNVSPPNQRAGSPATPVNLADLDLELDRETGRYQTVHAGFFAPGTYRVQFHALDEAGNVSLPVSSAMFQSVLKEDVIVVAAGATNAPQWAAINQAGNLAYRTFLARQFDRDSLHYLNSQPAQDLDDMPGADVDGVPTLAALSQALTNLAADADTVTLYLTGAGLSNALVFGNGEMLTTNVLAEWLNGWQHDNARQVNVILDFAGAGAFLPALAGYDARHQPGTLGRRVSVASTMANRPVVPAAADRPGFSQVLLRGILGGESLGDAALDARRVLRRTSGAFHQNAEIDDDENGKANEKDLDGLLSRQRFIGSSFVPDSDLPVIGRVMPPVVLSNAADVVVWAEGVTDEGAVATVRCDVQPPVTADGGAPVSLILAYNPLTLRYEAVYSNLVEEGIHQLTFVAEDTTGLISIPGQSHVLRMNAPASLTEADVYEVDDTAEEARLLDARQPQRHTFHTPQDVDWVRFYALSNLVYDLETVHFTTNVDTAITLYRQADDGALVVLDTVDLFGRTEGELAGLDFPASGFYFLHVRQVPQAEWLPGAYELRISTPAAGDVLIVVAVDKLHPDRAPPGAVATLDGGQSKVFGAQNSVAFPGVSLGWHQVQVTASPGYFPEEDPQQSGQVTNIHAVLYGNPKRVHTSSPVAIFQFVPQGRVEATVRDGITGEWLPGVSLSFTARNSVITGRTFTGYPAFAAYGVAWGTQPQGQFPGNVWLPTVDWDLALSAPGYASTIRRPALIGLVPGEVRQLGVFYLEPLDANANGIADAWEQAHYGTNAPTGSADADHDGTDDWTEYRLGTDPTNARSVLAVQPGVSGAAGFTLTWPVMAGRVYGVENKDHLRAPHWMPVAGPWTAQLGQTQMTWTNAGAYGATNRYYRIHLLLP